MYSLAKRNLRKKEPEASVTSGGFINAKILHCEDLKSNLRNKNPEASVASGVFLIAKISLHSL